MARGGKRPGAGRKKKPRNSPLFVSMLAIEGNKLTPLEIMLNSARAAYAAATKDPEKVDTDLLKLAGAWAKDAAPFVHARMMTHEVGGKGGGPLQMQVAGSVMFYVPESGRRVVPAAPANDEHVAQEVARAEAAG